MTYKIQPREVR